MEFLERGIKREEKSPRVLQYTQVYLEEGPTKDRKREWPVRSEENKEECHIMSQEKKVTEKEGAIKCQMLISNILKKKQKKKPGREVTSGLVKWKSPVTLRGAVPLEWKVKKENKMLSYHYYHLPT